MSAGQLGALGAECSMGLTRFIDAMFNARAIAVIHKTPRHPELWSKVVYG